MIKAIEKNPAYAIATIIKYGHASKGSTSAIIEFVDKNGNLINTITSERMIKPVKYVNKGNHYTVIYNITDPEECILLLDYPVIDSSYFNRYLEEFKINPPNLKR